MKTFRVAVVDDEPAILDSIRDYFDDHPITTFADPRHALRAFHGARFDILISDYRMPGIDGLELLREARRLGAYSYGILLTAYADKDLLMSALNEGLVARVVEKPLRLEIVARALADAQAWCASERVRAVQVDEALALYREWGRDSVPLCERIVGLDGGMATVFAEARRFAATRENVLVTGETGTGKEVVARLIHSLSERREGPFVKINCGAIPETLVESELFGHIKGAFSGANADKQGRIETAQGGTLLLDEIAEMRPDIQAKLLAVLQDRCVERIGSNQRRRVDFRLVCATNRNLESEVRGARFRQDLYFRIGTLRIHVPALRERRSDIINLAHTILESFCLQLGRRRLDLTQPAIRTLLTYSWPGNIRELENVIKRAVVLTDPSRSEIDAALLDCLRPASPEAPGHAAAVDQALGLLGEAVSTRALTLRGVEVCLLRRILERFDGSIPRASRSSGIPKDRFYRLGRETR